MDTPVNVTAKEYTIDGLINGTAYLVRVRAVDSAGNMGEWSDNGSGTPMAGDTDPAPPTDAGPDISAPTNFDVMPGDMMIMASWDKPGKGADLVKGYTVQTRSRGGAWDLVEVGMNYEVTIEGLTNGVEYDVWVCPYDGFDVRAACAVKTVTVMVPTPALPIFGAVALGAGLLAAGRARLRRRELRAGRVQRKINR